MARHSRFWGGGGGGGGGGGVCVEEVELKNWLTWCSKEDQVSRTREVHMMTQA